MGLVLLAGSRAATNEYYTKAEVKKIVDEVIAAYGGEEKLKQFERFKVHAEVKNNEGLTKITLYESKSKARFDMVADRLKVAAFYDGKEFVSVVNGREAPLTPPKVKEQLEDELKDGVFQDSVVRVFKNKEHDVLDLGKKKFDGTEYDVIETTDVRGKKKTHYFDRKTRRRMVETRLTATGEKQTIMTEAFGEYEGVLYEKRVIFKNADGSLQGSGRILEVTKDFEDSVFAPESAKGGNAI